MLGLGDWLTSPPRETSHVSKPEQENEARYQAVNAIEEE
jgi:hypothetical protein